MIRSFPNDWGYTKMVLSRTKHVITFEDIRQRVELEEERQEAIEMTGAKVHISPLMQGMVLKGRTKGTRVTKLFK